MGKVVYFYLLRLSAGMGGTLLDRPMCPARESLSHDNAHPTAPPVRCGFEKALWMRSAKIMIRTDIGLVPAGFARQRETDILEAHKSPG